MLQDRDYVNKLEGRFKPTALGVIISDLLSKSFEDIIDVEYTRSLEDDFDKIEQGKTDYVRTLAEFYKKFKKDLAKAGKEMQNLKEGIKTDEVCDRCGSPMLIKVGKFGPFVACSAYPECTNTRELEKKRTGVRERRRGDRALRELRQADGHEARPVRPVPRLLRLSRVQDDAKAHCDEAGRPEGGQAGSDSRREVPALQLEPRHQAGPLRRVHRVHQLSRLQLHQA